jgi:putative ABC transport system permease protein
MLYVHYETSYDKFNENYDRIYRLEGDDYGKLPPVVAAYVKDRIPEVENVTRLAVDHTGYVAYSPQHTPTDLKYVEANIVFADSTTFDVFTLPFVHGDPRTALREPFTVVLTESTSRKLFGDTNPMMERVMYLDFEFRVTGIIQDVKNSHIEIDALFSQESTLEVHSKDPHMNNSGSSSWLWSATYLLTSHGADKVLLERKINDVLAEINDGKLFDIEFKHFRIQPLADLYFDGSVQKLQYGLRGNLKLVQVLSAVGVLLLLLACINYINLTTARSIERIKEVAVKRVVGASLRLLRYQMILESVIVCLIALVAAITIVQITLPAFNLIAAIDLNTLELNRPQVWAGVVSCALFIGISAGIYPACYLTAGKPVGLMKGAPAGGSQGLPRKVLMTLQFAISVVMVICVIANLRQMHFVRSADLGFEKERVVTIHTPVNFPQEFSMRETFRERLLQHTNVTGVTFSEGTPGQQNLAGTVEFEGTKKPIRFFLIDDYYLDVMQMEIVEGRAPSQDRRHERFNNEKWASPENDRTSVLLNEAAVGEFGVDSPLGKVVYWTETNGRKIEWEVIGVVKDFHFRSMHHKVEPLLMIWTSPMPLAHVKISSSNVPQSLELLEREWRAVYGSKPFTYQFMDDLYYRHYRADENLGTVIAYFAVVAIVIASLGLFGLSSFMVSRRTKEIGIRKSIGASVKAIYLMLSWDFLRWILLAVVVACPIGWSLMNAWLETFAYHTQLEVDIFLIAAAVTFAVALATVTWQSLKAANANPIKSLRYE